MTTYTLPSSLVFIFPFIWDVESSCSDDRATPYHEALVGVDKVEEATEQIPGDMEEWQNDDVPDLHEPGAVEAVSLDHHDEEVEAGEKGSEDYKGAEDGREAYVEKAMEDGAEIYLEAKTSQRKQNQR